MRFSRWMTIFIFTMALLSVTVDAYAYIDPGTGSYILQIVLAFFLGALFALKMFWKNVKGFVVNLFSRGKKQADHER